VLRALLTQNEGVALAVLRKVALIPTRSCARWTRRWRRSRRCAVHGRGYVGRRMKDLLDEAARQSAEFKDEYVSSEHLLLALLSKIWARLHGAARGGVDRDTVLKAWPTSAAASG